jgi:LPXTG-site transpeptidase (sortase) family protein
VTDRAPRPGGRPSPRWAWLLLAVGGVGLGAAVAVALGGFPAASPGPSPGTAQASPAFTDLPLVTVPPVDATAAPSASPDPGSASPSAGPSDGAAQEIRAKRIRIPRLDIDLAIIEGDGIDAPIGKAAHYPGSAWPGGRSNIYVYGLAQEGMFISLWQARNGDEVELDLVDGSTRTYVVTKVLPKVPWDAVEYLEPTPQEQLTLQTSTSYEPTAPRFVVIAVPAP